MSIVRVLVGEKLGNNVVTMMLNNKEEIARITKLIVKEIMEEHV